ASPGRRRPAHELHAAEADPAGTGAGLRNLAPPLTLYVINGIMASRSSVLCPARCAASLVPSCAPTPSRSRWRVCDPRQPAPTWEPLNDRAVPRALTPRSIAV